MADEPDWLKTSSSAAAPSSSAPVRAASSTPSSAVNDPNPPKHKNLVKYTMLILNLGFMVFMAATGAIGVANADSVDDTGVIFVGIYMIFFAAIQFFFEITQVCRDSSIELIMRKNFGFLYGYVGKGLYLVFMGVLAFGLDPSGSEARSLSLACGVLVCAWGFILILFYFKFPQYFDKLEKYQP
eukprot:gene4400-4823_t